MNYRHTDTISIRKRRSGLLKNPVLYLMILPSFLIVFVLSYIPMAGITIAFKDFKFNLGFLKSPWIGFKNFEFFFLSGKAWLLVKNTFLYNITFIIVNNVLEVIFAIIISELTCKKYKRFFQSTMILPYFLSWVAVGAFVYSLFNHEFGTLNTFLKDIGLPPVEIYSKPGTWKILLPAMNAWKIVGYNSIIYISAITGINEELYESAYLDGAGIYKRIWYITLPCLKPTIIIMILLSLGRVLKGNFEMFYQLVGTNGQLYDMTDIIDTYIFRTVVYSTNSIGTASAAGFLQQIVGFTTVVTVNTIIKKIAPDYVLF